MSNRQPRLRIQASAQLLLFGIAVSGCGQPAAMAGIPLPLGARCTVQLRRDVLGAGASAPISPTVQSNNGAAVSISGDLIRADDDWLIVRSDGKDRWIARQAVLLVEFTVSK